MNLSQYKKWRVLLHRVIAKEQAKREQTHPVCLHAVEKFEKVGNANTQWLWNNDFKIVQKNSLEIKNNIKKKITSKSHWSQWSLHDKYGQSKAKDWR